MIFYKNYKFCANICNQRFFKKKFHDNSMSKMIDLKNLSCYFLTVDKKRAEHTNRVCQKTFASVFCVNGCREFKGQKNNIISGALGHCEMIRQALLQEKFEPFVILEDDVALNLERQSTVVDVPNGSDAVFLGISYCALTSQTGAWHPNQPLLVDFNDSNQDCVRIFNMLSTHAILILSKNYAISYLTSLIQFIEQKRLGFEPVGWDCLTARVSFQCKVYALRIPIFFQDAALLGRQYETKINLDQAALKQISTEEMFAYKQYPLLSECLEDMKSIGNVSVNLPQGLGNKLFAIS